MDSESIIDELRNRDLVEKILIKIVAGNPGFL